MKNIRKFAITLCLLGVLAAPVQAAAVQTVVGYVQQTGIQAQIDGHPLRSYNVNGRTAVVVTDLAGYGFNVIWDGAERTYWVEQGIVPTVWPAQTKNTGAGGYVQDTDIVTYVAGEQVECFRVGGETAIYLEELTRYGQLQWIAQEQTARLVVTKDPMSWGLEQEVAALKKADASATYQLFSGQEGTLLVGRQQGKTSMTFFETNGTRVSLTDLMPQGAADTIEPDEIRFDRSQAYLTFTTPLRDGQLDWGDTLCRYDIQRRLLTFAVPGDDGYTSSLERGTKVVQLRRNLVDWRESAGSGSQYRIYERADYTLFYSQYTGTPHGVSTQLVLVQEDGSTVDVIAQLPEYGFGACYYAQIQDLSVPGEDAPITFRTQVPGETEGSWQDAQCSLNPSTGVLSVTVEQPPADTPADPAEQVW